MLLSFSISSTVNWLFISLSQCFYWCVFLFLNDLWRFCKCERYKYCACHIHKNYFRFNFFHLQFLMVDRKFGKLCAQQTWRYCPSSRTLSALHQKTHANDNVCNIIWENREDSFTKCKVGCRGHSNGYLGSKNHQETPTYAWIYPFNKCIGPLQCARCHIREEVFELLSPPFTEQAICQESLYYVLLNCTSITDLAKEYEWS